MRILFTCLFLLFSFPASAEPSLDEVLQAQSDDHKTRYQYRNPKQTLEFFGVKPGNTVVEALPGGGWYSKILVPYLGENGTLIGLDYNLSIWSNFSFANEAFVERRKQWPQTWPKQAAEWGESNTKIMATQMGSIPEELHGTADTVLFIRALHNLVRFNEGNNYLQEALADSYALLKPNGILGVVQHQAREDRPDDWADGSNGYLKKSTLIEQITAAGFEFVEESSINENPQDQADVGDKVWRLPPSNRSDDASEEQKANYQIIGESNRMTLKFRKPSS